MAVRRIRTDGTGSAVIAAANNAPTGVAANSAGNETVLKISEFTTFADKYNALLAALVAHGVVNSA
jgi:hypothetical protein